MIKVTALKKQVFQQLKTEFAIITGIFLLSFIAFKIAFMPESAFVILKAVFAFFWIFILPGYFIMLYWLDELKLHERMIIGIAASASAIGLSSYYLGVLGLHIKHHVILL